MRREDRLLAMADLETPAVLYDLPAVRAAAAAVRRAVADAGARLLYSVKTQSFAGLLRTVMPYVDGFAAASVFEARLAREVLDGRGEVHLTLPGLRPGDMEEAVRLCDHVSFNSLSQLRAFAARHPGPLPPGLGVRVNPGVRLVADPRYAPCRPHSKLGVPVEALAALLAAEPALEAAVTGVNLHHHSDCADFDDLLATARHVLPALRPLRGRLRWMNLGGGYFFSTARRPELFGEAVALLREELGVEVYVEPGTALAQEAVFLLASVVDLFESDGKEVAVLDTTINHMPDVFAYQLPPPVYGAAPRAPHAYLLAGASCLAGDLFGEYRFATPLRPGSRVLFPSFGAYTTVKANLFNGINLPAWYAVDEDGTASRRREFDYGDYLAMAAGEAPEARAMGPDLTGRVRGVDSTERRVREC